MQAIDLGAILEQMLIVALKLSAPALLTALAVGLVVSLVQAITQINEATLAFVPKLVAISLVLVFVSSFMATTLITFSHHLFDQMILVGST